MKDFRIYTVTWNVYGTQPQEGLHEMLRLSDFKKAKERLPDLYAIGLQEVNAQPQNMVLEILFDDPWTWALTNALKPFKYMRLKVERLQGIMLFLFIKKKHLSRVTGLQADYTRVGLGGMWGNKGGIGIRLNIFGCSICFVNTHLSANDDELDKRIAEYSSILDGQHFNDPLTDHIITHDYVFWIGDLNFRIDMSIEDSHTLVQKNELSELLQYDQLRKVMNSGEAFSEFRESDPTFPPTYKFITNTDDYNPSRIPSWTDRIVYRFTPNAYENATLELHQKDYRSHLCYKQSDHKPVSSKFTIKVFDRHDTDFVQFYSISNWWTNTDNYALYTVSSVVKTSNYDWIGLYKADFVCVNDYLCYVWASVKPISDTEKPTIQQRRKSSSASSSQGHEDDASASPSTSEQQFKSAISMSPVYRVTFTDQSVILPGSYRLVYVSRDFDNVLCVSQPFEVKKKS
ncbi:INPP5J (predicted) [Pycnogonum litorale]